MVSTRPPGSKFFSPFNNPLVIVPKAPITINIIVTFMFQSFFTSPARSKYLSFFSLSFSFSLWSKKFTILQVHFFCRLLLGLVFWPRLGEPFICQSPIEFMCVILHERCWVVYKSFVRMVKFKFIAHLPVYHLAKPVVSSLIHILC